MGPTTEQAKLSSLGETIILNPFKKSVVCVLDFLQWHFKIIYQYFLLNI